MTITFWVSMAGYGGSWRTLIRFTNDVRYDASNIKFFLKLKKIMKIYIKNLIEIEYFSLIIMAMVIIIL